MSDPAPILKLIRDTEAQGAAKTQGVPDAYGVVWGGIRAADRPQVKLGKALTDLTVAQVLAWQDSIDARYQSEAAGGYQIMEDTLRALGVPGSMRFDPAGQDACAMVLLNRRGWSNLLAGKITKARFADNIAREWASFPVTSDQKGASRTVKAGQSYYAGDGLNHALVEVSTVMGAIADSLGAAPAPTPTPDADAMIAALVEWRSRAPADFAATLDWLRSMPA